MRPVFVLLSPDHTDLSPVKIKPESFLEGVRGNLCFNKGSPVRLFPEKEKPPGDPGRSSVGQSMVI